MKVIVVDGPNHKVGLQKNQSSPLYFFPTVRNTPELDINTHNPHSMDLKAKRVLFDYNLLNYRPRFSFYGKTMSLAEALEMQSRDLIFMEEKGLAYSPKSR